MKSSGKKKAHLFGVAMPDDEHKRITQAEKFSIVGGSEEVHETMSEVAIKTFEKLKKKGKELEEVEPKELSDIIIENWNNLK